MDLGSGPPVGVYLLYLHVAQPIAVTFGRFHDGKPLLVPAGDLLYIGSAFSDQRPTLLARRLLRHAQRTGARPAHPLAVQLAAHFGVPRSAAAKRLRWHIDYLLDAPEVTLAQVVILRTRRREEHAVATYFNALPVTAPLAVGLGASDDPGLTHLLIWLGDANAWANALTELAAILQIHV